MEDAAGAKEAALSLIAWGADYLSGKLNAGQLGIIKAAKEKGIHAKLMVVHSSTQQLLRTLC